MSSKTGNSANFCEIQWIQAQENWGFSANRLLTQMDWCKENCTA